MKAKELMIGDWGNINESNPLYARVSYVNNWKVGLEGITDRDAEDIYPIPLTEDILKANGISSDQYTFYDGYNFSLTDGKRNSIVVGSLWFVHELQHALRLVGLTELADNFKIE